ncbi:aprataxin [Anoplophora glabripennis]|uniref:aprataxin n=1 Tax=Anoplophora glabripennis TaxID=217634 RepID=UPI000874173E|nr:aprataxin [Anoplophora glabripennis]
MSKRKHENKDVTNEEKKLKPSGHWTTGLLKTIEDPKYIVSSDDLVTVIKDVYPKAEFHYLILPKEDISSLKSVKKDHLHLLNHMEATANKLVAEEKHKHRNFKISYHAEASMLRLHLHVISDDMNSPCVKTKKHWNSFNTDFFLKSTDVIEGLKENGKVILPSRDECKKYMETPLKCHKCEYLPKHMPDLKRHILKHVEK